MQRKFTVKNPEKTDLVFTVESDLPFISGEATLRIPGGGKADYTLVLNPQVRVLLLCVFYLWLSKPLRQWGLRAFMIAVLMLICLILILILILFLIMMLMLFLTLILILILIADF